MVATLLLLVSTGSTALASSVSLGRRGGGRPGPVGVRGVPKRSRMSDEGCWFDEKGSVPGGSRLRITILFVHLRVVQWLETLHAEGREQRRGGDRHLADHLENPALLLRGQRLQQTIEIGERPGLELASLSEGGNMLARNVLRGARTPTPAGAFQRETERQTPEFPSTTQETSLPTLRRWRHQGELTYSATR